MTLCRGGLCDFHLPYLYYGANAWGGPGFLPALWNRDRDWRNRGWGDSILLCRARGNEGDHLHPGGPVLCHGFCLHNSSHLYRDCADE